MRLLFSIDKKDYDLDCEAFVRPSARAIIVRKHTLAMIYSRKYDFFKLPGGGIEPGENGIQSMIREVKEETGLTVIPESVKEYGYVHRIQKGKHEPVFIQDNYYYLCDVTEEVGDQELSDNEKAAEFVLQFVKPIVAISKNREHDCKGEMDSMLEREALVLEFLITEGVVN
jgi:8-oxo-dGTP pyrophosphatase MutT (NUDIX family)